MCVKTQLFEDVEGEIAGFGSSSDVLWWAGRQYPGKAGYGEGSTGYSSAYIVLLGIYRRIMANSQYM